jgi:hypothetical protein
VVRSCPSPVGRVHLSLNTCCNFLRTRRTQWVASPFNAASSPTSAERSRAVSLATSFGSSGAIYEPNILSRTVAIPLPGRCQRVTHAG